jgi:hypothetical protein
VSAVCFSERQGITMEKRSLLVAAVIGTLILGAMWAVAWGVRTADTAGRERKITVYQRKLLQSLPGKTEKILDEMEAAAPPLAEENYAAFLRKFVEDANCPSHVRRGCAARLARVQPQAADALYKDFPELH